MMLILFVFIEAITVLILLCALYGKKVRIDGISLLFIVTDCLLMYMIRNFGVNQNLSFIVYLFLIIYCFIEFKSRISEMIVNIVLLAVIMMGIQLSALLVLEGLQCFLQGYEDLSVVIVNIVIFMMIFTIYKRCNIHTISLSFQQKGKNMSILLLLESSLVFFVVYQYKNVYGKVPVQYTIISGILVLLVILCIHGLLYRIKYHEKQAELEAYKTYSAAFSDLITQIRARQHEFDNHISALCNIHYICKDYDELVKEQSQYAKDVISNNRFHKLLVSGNPVIAGFLYGKLSSIEQQGVSVSYDVHMHEFTGRIPVYLFIELIGNLLKNAVEAVNSQNDEKCIHLTCKNEETYFCLSVRNVSPEIPIDEIGKFFEKGYSSKGRERGLGLYNVKEICDNYGIDIICQNAIISERNWFLIELHIK